MRETLQELGSQPPPAAYWGSSNRVDTKRNQILKLWNNDRSHFPNSDTGGGREEGWQSPTATKGNINTEIKENLHSSSKTNFRSTPNLGRLWLTGDLLDLVDHHKGIRQAHLHRVVHRADLRHLDRNLKQKNTTISHFPIWQHQWGKYWTCVASFPPHCFNLDLCWITRLIGFYETNWNDLRPHNCFRNSTKAFGEYFRRGTEWFPFISGSC